MTEERADLLALLRDTVREATRSWRLPVVFGEILATSDLPGGVVNLVSKRPQAQRAGELESILVRTLGDMGVKMMPVLSNSIYALLATEGSFHDIPKLLDPQDASYRRRIAGELDERTREFFEKYDASTYYKDVYEPIINRLDPLLRPPLSTTLTTPALDFDHILNHSSSIVLCNLSRLRGFQACLLYTSPSPRDRTRSRMPSSA